MTAVPLRDAATIVVLRDGQQGLEVLMAKRGQATRFSAGAHVFPGGGVDASDRLAIPQCRGADAARAERRFGEPEALRYYVAAARELFEETGLWLFDGERPEDWPALRRSVHQSHSLLHEVLEQRHIGLDCETIYYYRFWTTPPGPPRRYRTRFFLARAPRDQSVETDGVELTEHCWVRPAAMLERHAAGEVELIFPTLRELQVLRAYGSADAAIMALQGAAQIAETRSRHLIVNGRYVRSVAPGDPGYEDLPAW